MARCLYTNRAQREQKNVRGIFRSNTLLLFLSKEKNINDEESMSETRWAFERQNAIHSYIYSKKYFPFIDSFFIQV